MLEFEVSGQIISRTDSTRIVADSRNYLKARFILSEEWQGDVYALFGHGGSFFQVLIDGENSCMVPFEVIKMPSFSVSLFCNGEKLVTANVVLVNVEKSGFEDGEVPGTPSPTIWRQYMSEVQSVIENGLPYIGDNGHWFLYNTESGDYENTGILAKGTMGPVGERGEAGYSPRKGVDYWTDTDKTEIVNDVLTALPAAEGVEF